MENDAAFPSVPMIVLTGQTTSHLCHGRGGPESFLPPFYVLGSGTWARCVVQASLLDTDTISPTLCPRSRLFPTEIVLGCTQGLGLEAGGSPASAETSTIPLPLNLAHLGKGMSNCTAPKQVYSHCFTHLEHGWWGHPAQGDCALKRKRGRCLATCVNITIS